MKSNASVYGIPSLKNNKVPVSVPVLPRLCFPLKIDSTITEEREGMGGGD